ncbi:hypothetical protein [Vibrio gallicus]|uniref:hypothetical protein n=1 Tax=Vibrio gallicus TaxID=190897 RepID=UPI0021C2B251|nr:hypothetical protein [Vibrio gallicus]
MNQPSISSLLTLWGFQLPTSTQIKSADRLFVSECQALESLFFKAKATHSQYSDEQLLLGVLAHKYQGLLGAFQQQLPSLLAMRGAIDDNISAEFQGAFQAHIVQQIWLTLHLWLFVQGRLQMDYSLANDYAGQGAELIGQLTTTTTNEWRSQWNQSFYLGRDSKQTKNSCLKQLLIRLRKLLS